MKKTKGIWKFKTTGPSLAAKSPEKCPKCKSTSVEKAKFGPALYHYCRSCNITW